MFNSAGDWESFQDFCIERQEKLDALKTDEECPGERECVEEPGGVCYQQGVSLETFCKKDRCRLYFTKNGACPVEYEALLEAGIRLRERQLNNLAIDESELTLYEIISFTVFSRAERITTNKKYERDEEERKKDAEQPKGVPGRGFNKGDSSAFAWSAEQLQEMYEQRERLNKERQQRSRGGKKFVDVV